MKKGNLMNKEFYDRLLAVVSEGAAAIDEPMSRHTTFRIGGTADVFVSPAIEQIPAIVDLTKEYAIPLTVIGNGSNLLVADKGIRGLVLSIGKGAEGIRMDGTRMTVSAGTLLSKAAAEAARNGLTGLEFAAGIPGTLGGALVMNAGAYGGEMKDVVTGAKVLTPSAEVLSLSAEELEFSYRHSCIPEKGYIVLEVTMELAEGDEAQIRDTMADFRARRTEKQPLEFPSAGSTFKRPEGHFAGKLIQDAGLRGYSVGDAQVSEKHCGFVINKGNATAEEVCNLIQDVKRIVYEKFQVEMEAEVKMIGEF